MKEEFIQNSKMNLKECFKDCTSKVRAIFILTTVVYFVCAIYFALSLYRMVNNQLIFTNIEEAYTPFALNDGNQFEIDIDPSIVNNRKLTGINIHYFVPEENKANEIGVLLFKDSSLVYSNKDVFDPNNIIKVANYDCRKIADIYQKKPLKSEHYTKFDFGFNVKINKNSKVKMIVYGNNIEIKTDEAKKALQFKLYGNLLPPPIQIALFILYSLVIIFAYILCFWFFFINQKLDSKKIFLTLAIVEGLFFTFGIAPTRAPDELVHLDTCYTLSNFILGIKDKPNEITRRETDTKDLPEAWYTKGWEHNEVGDTGIFINLAQNFTKGNSQKLIKTRVCHFLTLETSLVGYFI